MPEMLTKYPDVALKILTDAKISCGTGAKQTILTKCPAKQFCALPTGELCIYGTNDIPHLTQIHALDLILAPGFVFTFIGALVLTFLAGMLAGIYLKR